MKTRIINLVIINKFNHWLETIDDDRVKQLVKDNTICTGGSIASMLLKEEANDFDFYFRNKETAKAVADYYVKKFLTNPTQNFLSKHTGNVGIFVEDKDDRVKITVKSAGAASEGGELSSYRYF